MARTGDGRTVLGRAVRVLEALAEAPGPVGTSEVARRAGLPTSTASRLVAQLVDLGLLERLEGRRVRASYRWWELAQLASPALPLRETARPFLEDLHAVVGQHTQLGVLDGHDVLFLERLSARGAVVNLTEVAGRVPLHASSSGLVLLANAAPALVDEVLARPLRAYTDATTTSPGQLRAVLSDVRRTDVAACHGSIHPGATSVAVPVRDERRVVVAALSVVVPRGTSPVALTPALRATARGVERSLRDQATPSR